MSHAMHRCFRDAAASLSQAGYAYDRELQRWTHPDGSSARIERTKLADAARAYVVRDLEPARRRPASPRAHH